MSAARIERLQQTPALTRPHELQLQLLLESLAQQSWCSLALLHQGREAAGLPRAFLSTERGKMGARAGHTGEHGDTAMSDGRPTGEEFRQGFMGRGAEAWTVGLPPKLGGRLVVTRKACWRGTKDRLRSSQRLTGGPRHRQWVQVEWV